MAWLLSVQEGGHQFSLLLSGEGSGSKRRLGIADLSWSAAAAAASGANEGIVAFQLMSLRLQSRSPDFFLLQNLCGLVSGTFWSPELGSGWIGLLCITTGIGSSYSTVADISSLE